MAHYKSTADAVKDLRRCDHAFLDEEGVKGFADAFGVTLKCFRHYANPNDPKGLTFHNGAKSGIGMDASIMAMKICRQLNVEYLDMFGRGSQLRVCCDALEKHFR